MFGDRGLQYSCSQFKHSDCFSTGKKKSAGKTDGRKRTEDIGGSLAFLKRKTHPLHETLTVKRLRDLKSENDTKVIETRDPTPRSFAAAPALNTNASIVDPCAVESTVNWLPRLVHPGSRGEDTVDTKSDRVLTEKNKEIRSATQISPKKKHHDSKRTEAFSGEDMSEFKEYNAAFARLFQ